MVWDCPSTNSHWKNPVGGLDDTEADFRGAEKALSQSLRGATGSTWLAAPGGMVGEESVRKKCLCVEEVFSHCYTFRHFVKNAD